MALQSFFRKQFTLLNFEFIHEWIHTMQYYVFIFFLDQLILSMRDMVRRNKAINLLHPQNRNTLSSLYVQKPSCYFRTFEKYIFFEIELLLLLSKSCKMHEPVICYPFMHFGNLWSQLTPLFTFHTLDTVTSQCTTTTLKTSAHSSRQFSSSFATFSYLTVANSASCAHCTTLLSEVLCTMVQYLKFLLVSFFKVTNLGVQNATSCSSTNLLRVCLGLFLSPPDIFKSP